MPTRASGTFLRRGLIAWLGLPPIAVANGLFREAALVPAVGERAASVLTVLTFLGLAWPYACLFLRWAGHLGAPRDLWLLGACWTALAIAFEFAFFGLALGVPMGKLLQSYDISRGELWPIVLLGVLLAPRLMAAVCARSD
jgi:hypothetical protein